MKKHILLKEYVFNEFFVVIIVEREADFFMHFTFTSDKTFATSVSCSNAF